MHVILHLECGQFNKKAIVIGQYVVMASIWTVFPEEPY